MRWYARRAVRHRCSGTATWALRAVQRTPQMRKSNATKLLSTLLGCRIQDLACTPVGKIKEKQRRNRQQAKIKCGEGNSVDELGYAMSRFTEIKSGQ